MTRNAQPSSRLQEPRFPNVLLTVVSSSSRHSAPSQVWLAISNRIYWKDADQDEPKSLADFRGASSLSVSRLANGKSWDSVECCVSPCDDEHVNAIVVRGKLHGPARRRRVNANVQLLLTAHSLDQRNRWLHAIRARVAPAQLLHQRLTGIIMPSTAALQDVKKRVKQLLVGDAEYDFANVLAEQESASPSQLVENVADLQRLIEKLQLADKATMQTKSLAESITKCAASSAVEISDTALLAARANQMAQAVDLATSATSFMPVISSTFKLVGLGVDFVAKLAHVVHGSRILPELLGQVIGYLRILLLCITEALNPRMNVEHLFSTNMFSVLTGTFDTMGAIEGFLMQGKVGRVMDSSLVNDLEANVKELGSSIVTVVHTCKLLKRRLEVEMELEREVGDLVPRPLLTNYFVGRTRELDKLRNIVDKYGSAVISQFGGIGKTQLMVKFSQNAELHDAIPGGAYWVTAEGGAEQVVHSLAIFVEQFRQKKMNMEDRRDPRMVVAALERCLLSAKGKWLLCLDNVDCADDPEVSRLLDMVCSIADPVKRNGWIVVTSRQGRSTLWNGMKKDQRLELGPLSKDDAMCLLWRFINSMSATEGDDATIMADVFSFKDTNLTEFVALVELCGHSGSCSLAGLPLAIIQAGTYMRQFQCTISEYLKLYEEADGKAEVEELFQKCKSKEFDPVRAEQRAILTTWKISVERLSNGALEVLRALSMLGNAPIPDALLNRILKKMKDDRENVFIKSLNFVQKELVYGTSLVQQERNGHSSIYNMHRLVRLFVLVEMEALSEEWTNAFDQASTSTHEYVGKRLRAQGLSFDVVHRCSVFCGEHFTLVSHALEVANHCSRFYGSANESRDMIVLVPLHTYVGFVLKFVGRYRDEEKAWKGQLRILEHHYGDESREEVACALGNLGNVCELLEKLDEAESMHRRCLEMERAIHGQNASNSQIAETLNNLGNVYHALGKFELAQQTLQECIEMQYEVYGRDISHPAIANALGNMGNLFKSLGKLKAAQEMQHKCLAMKRAAYGQNTDHLAVARTLANLSQLYLDLGKLEEAKATVQESLKMNRAIYGHNACHPTVVDGLIKSGNVYLSLGKYEEAKGVLNESLQMLRMIHRYDINDSSVADVLGNLGAVYEKQGRLEEAKAKLYECLEMRKAIYGSNANHPAIASALGNFGGVLYRLRNFEEAEVSLRECLFMKHAIYGLDECHPSIVLTLCNLGNVYKCMGKVEEAEDTVLECLKMERALYGSDVNHPSIASTLCTLGMVYAQLGKLDEALLTHQECLEMWRSIYGLDANHTDIADSLFALGLTHVQFHNDQEGVSLIYESLAMFRNVLGANSQHPNIAYIERTLVNLGVAPAPESR